VTTRAQVPTTTHITAETGTAPATTVDASAPPGQEPLADALASSVAAGIDARRLERPIVVRLRKGRKKRGRKRYSRGFKDLQRWTYGGSRALYRLGNSLAAGFDSFSKRSSRSARRRRDGLLRDSLKNGARGFDRAAREAGRAPYEIARRISTRRYWRAGRDFRGVLVPWPLSFFLR
jgi:hypothetical protein